MKPPCPITNHAIERWQQRVDRGASRSQARLAIAQILELGRRRSRPRHWMTESPAGPGTQFVYLASRPSVCVVLVNAVAVTVVTRDLARSCRRERASYMRVAKRPAGRPHLRLVEDSPAWDEGEFEEAA